MRIYLYKVDDSANTSTDHLSSEARERLSRYKSGEAYMRSLCAYNLVYSVYPDRELCFTDKGKPYIEGIDADLSISHSEDMVVIAIAPSPVGVDVEQIRDVDYSNIIRFAMTEREKGCIVTPVDFYRYWTVKEAYAKATGRGLKGFPIDIEVYDDCVMDMPYHSMIIDDTYVLSVVSHDLSEIEVIRAKLV